MFKCKIFMTEDLNNYGPCQDALEYNYSEEEYKRKSEFNSITK